VAALSAISKTGALCKDLTLRSQIDDCADSILSNLSEGFEQGTDRGFARYLYIARGSCTEARAHLTVAEMRGHLPAATNAELQKSGKQVARLITGLISYLLRSNRKQRVLR
jgi:four helix bundle protein